jgi:3-hydroxyacyl-CoA dehydrogenase
MNKVKKIGVVGEGKMGTSIFFFLHDFDFHLTWLCSSDQEKGKAQKSYHKKAKIFLMSGVLSESDYTNKLEHTKITDSINELSDCDLIIEAVTENIEVKRQLFESLDHSVNPNCIFASNSSSIVPSRLVPSESRRDKVAGLHFFFPVNLKNTVELITFGSTALHTKDLLYRFLLQIHKKPFLQDESYAFVMNRLLLDFQAYAFEIVRKEGLSHRQVDEWVRQFMFPIGVFEFFDQVGIDVMLSSIKTYINGSINREFYQSMVEELEYLISMNRLGIKTRSGLFNYADTSIDEEDDPHTFFPQKQSVINRLWDYYIRGVNQMIEAGICTREEMACYLKDYLGTDSDPFSRLPG